MSLGSIIGGVVGGVVGFFVGGPSGAYYGAVLGFGIGMAIDPITPDIPAPGIPDPEQQVMSSEIGGPIPDLCGTAKPQGHLLFFGKERNEKVYSEASSGGKGGGGDPEPQVTGFKYFMSWGVGIVQCPDNPVDVIYAIYKNDDVDAVWPIFETEEEADTWEGLPLPVSGGQETIIIEGIGSVIFSFGTDDQQPIAKVAEIITDPTLNTPYRHLCWAFFDDCFIGEYNRTPTYRFMLKKIPQITAMPDNAQIDTYDCNPAHALYYIFNVLSGLDVSWLDTDSFNNTATTLFNERRGICLLLEQQQAALSYIENINGHVDNIVRYDSDGKFHLKLIRDDYAVDDLPLIDESVMLDDPSFNRGSWIDTVNELKVQYSEIISGFRLREPSLIPVGELVASVSKRANSQIYAYNKEAGAIVKINTADTNPIVTDYLVINDDPVNYILDYNEYSGSTRGAYAISKTDYNKIWYLFKNTANGNLKLVEIDITTYPMTVIETSIHTGILDFGVGEYFNDGCAVDNYCFFPTSKLSGRILRFDSDHVLLDKEFNYSLTGSTDEPIHSITINPIESQICWLYNKHQNYVKCPYASYSFIVDWTYSEQDIGADPALWQNFLRYDDFFNYIFRQRIYWPANGVAYYYSDWDQNIGRAYIQNLQYMKQYLGGNASYFYVIHKDTAGGKSYLHRFLARDSTLGGALEQIDIEVTAYANEYTGESFNSVYNDVSNKSCMLRYSSVNGLNYIATFNSSLTEVSNVILDTVYWGR